MSPLPEHLVSPEDDFLSWPTGYATGQQPAPWWSAGFQIAVSRYGIKTQSQLFYRNGYRSLVTITVNRLWCTVYTITHYKHELQCLC